MKRLFAIGLMLLGTSLPVRAAEPAQDVLAAVPEDAWAVLAARNVGELDRKLTTLSQQLVNQAFSPLAIIKSHFGLIAGVRDDGGAAAVLMPVDAPGPDMAKNAIFLIPTTGMKELLTVMEPEDAGEGVSKIMLGGSPAYAASKGGFAVLGRAPELVKKFAAADGRFTSRCAPQQLKRFGEDDLALLINMEAVGAAPFVQQGLAFLATKQIDTSWITDLRAAQISLRFDAKGIRLTAFTDAKPGSRLAQVAGTQSTTDKSMLVGLPKEGYVLALGATMSKEAAAEGSKSLEAMLTALVAQAGPQGEALAKIGQQCLAMVGRARAAAMSISALPEGPNGLIGLASVMTVEGGARQSLADFSKIVESVNNLITSQAADKIDGALLELTPAAEKAGDVDVSRLSVRTDRIKEMDADARTLLHKVVGEEGLVIRMAAVDSDHVAMTFGGGLTRTQAVVNLVRDNRSPLDEDAGIASSRANLPKERNSELYLSVDRLLKLVKDVARATDNEVPPISMPELQAPVGMASAPAGKSATQAEVFFPMELIQAIRDVAMATMMGGMRGGPPS